jgi:putative tryptophan/tyrosine transport system substrate-binding protein
MRRRSFIAGALSAATIGTARAQQTGRVHRIAIVNPAEPIGHLNEIDQPRRYGVLFRELRRLGYVEGQNLSVQRFSGEGRTQYYPQLAQEVVQRNLDVILVSSSRLVLDFKSATTTIPIVGLMADPVAAGIVPNLAHPGGNITGISVDAGLEIWGKRLEQLRGLNPAISRVGYLASRAVWEAPYGAGVQAAARRLGISLVGPPLEGSLNETEYRRVFAAMTKQGVEAVLTSDQPEHFTFRHLIVELSANARLPAAYSYREFAEIGGLMAYAFDTEDLYSHAASAIGQILNGTEPGDIPIYQPTKFSLIINLKAAKAIGIEIPASLLASADEVIE